MESFFIKLHVPEEGAAFWARYTLRRPVSGAGEPVGCLWGVFSRVTGDQTAGCDIFPADQVATGTEHFYLKIGPGELSMGRATGKVTTEAAGGSDLEWDLSFEAGAGCVAHFPAEAMYNLGFPRNKLASPHVSTRFYGTIKAGERTYRVDGARGMQGHNWGPAVSDHWVWSHMNTFEGHDDAVFEGVSSILRIGPVTLPSLTILYLRVDGNEWLFNGLHQMILSRSETRGLTWKFAGSSGNLRLSGSVVAQPELTTSLDYISSDASTVRCLNSNLSDARLALEGLPGGRRELTARRTATLEMGGRAATVDIPVVVSG